MRDEQRRGRANMLAWITGAILLGLMAWSVTHPAPDVHRGPTGVPIFAEE